MTRRPLTARERAMFEDLERQVNTEAARQRAIKAKVITDTGIGAQPTAREPAPWEATQNGLQIGISSILAAFSRRENSARENGGS